MTKEVYHDKGGNFISSMGQVLLRLSLKYMPDASIFAIVLTFIAFALGVALTDQGPFQMVKNWYKGFWELLGFSMQMALIVITGSCVANAPAIKKWIDHIASIPKSAKSAVFTVTFVSIIVSFIHWGLSLSVGAILAKELAKNLRQEHIPFEYGLLAAGAYVGQMTWQGMLSSSIGLFISSPGHVMENLIGVVPMSQYMLNPMNIGVTIALAILPPLMATLLLPKSPDLYQPLDEEAIAAIEKESLNLKGRPEHPTVGEFLNYSPVLAWALGILGFTYIGHAFYTKGLNALDFNMLNAVFLFGGILLYGNIANYMVAFKDAVSGTAGIIFQFPLYAGIMGIVKYSGLVAVLANGMAAVSTETTFYFWTFISASIVNMFVPSGGGQWVVQGPVALESAKLIGADPIKTALMVGYGNTWTNMAQPFWAIALLGITGLKAKDIMGYSIGIMILSGIIFVAAAFL